MYADKELSMIRCYSMNDYRHMFIKVCSVIGIDRYVHKSTAVDTAERTRDRTNPSKRILGRCSGDCRECKEAHRGRDCECLQSVLRQLHEEGEAGQSREGQRRKGSQEKDSTASIRLYLLSLFLSPNFIYYLQFIDDICAQINPILWSMMFQ